MYLHSILGRSLNGTHLTLQKAEPEVTTMLCGVTASLLFLQAIVLLVSQLVYVCMYVCVCVSIYWFVYVCVIVDITRVYVAVHMHIYSKIRALNRSYKLKSSL